MPPTDRPTPTVTSYPDQNPNTYHPNVLGEEKLFATSIFLYEEMHIVLSFPDQKRFCKKMKV